jgi:hypothetical protein
VSGNVNHFSVFEEIVEKRQDVAFGLLDAFENEHPALDGRSDGSLICHSPIT